MTPIVTRNTAEFGQVDGLQVLSFYPLYGSQIAVPI